MQPLGKNILIIVLVATTLVVGIAWYIFRPEAAPQTPGSADTQGSAGYPSRSTVTVSTPQTQAQTQVALDSTQTAFDNLFKNLLAQRVAFVDVDLGSTGVEGEIYKLYAGDLARNKQLYPNTTDSSIQVAMLDLNEDGVAEALVYEDIASYCGTGGCAFEIYQKKQGTWTMLFTTLAGPDVAIANVISNGYFSLYLSTREDLEYGTSIQRFSWDGASYKPGEVMAVWDGMGFIYPAR